MSIGPLRLLGLIIVVGVLVGLTAVGFDWLLQVSGQLFFGFFGLTERVAIADQLLNRPYLIMLPAIGGLLTGLFLYFVAKGAKPGVPDVIGRIETDASKIPARHGAYNIVASSLTIGSGGSAGPEGSVIQIGAAFGSGVAGWLKLSRDDVRTLLACGAAAGFGALFGTPIAGIFFVMEVLLREFNTRRLALVAIAALVGYSITEYVFGISHILVSEPIAHQGWNLLPLFVLLGLVAAPFGVGFSTLTYQITRFSQSLSIKPWFKPALGGLLVGVIGLFFPRIFGVGEIHMEQAIHGGLPLVLLLLLPFAKLIATSITIGSGGAGGIFVPAMFIGATFGAAFGVICQHLFPGLGIDPSVFAVVGAGVVLAVVIDAPLTALLIVVELSAQFSVLPVAVASIAPAVLFAFYIRPESMYTLQLKLRGVIRPPLSMPNPLANAFVNQHTSSLYPTVASVSTVRAAKTKIKKSKADYLLVVSPDKRLVGIVSQQILGSADSAHRHVGDLAQSTKVLAYEDETLHDVLRRPESLKYPVIPVINKKGDLIAVLPREKLLEAYAS